MSENKGKTDKLHYRYSAISEQKGIFRSTPTTRVNNSVRDIIPVDVAEKLCVLPLARRRKGDGYVISILVPDDHPSDLIQTLKFITDSDVELIPASRKHVEEEVFKNYRGDESSIRNSLVSIKNETQPFRAPSKAERTEELLKDGDGRAAQILRALLDYSIAHEASDLHLFPESGSARAFLRMNGLLYTHENELCPIWTLERMVQLIKVLCELDTTVKFRPQDGSFIYRAITREIAVRVSILPTVHGEKIVMRILGAKAVKDLDSLSYNKKSLNMIRRAIHQEDGLIIFSGSTGSGKSTALYGAIEELRGTNVSIATIENPVEQVIPGISQTEVNEAKGVDYPLAMKAILRQDPDVILVGETRDKASAETVIQAALTGHLILTTVHGRNVFDCIRRLMFLSSEPNLVPDAIRLVVHQRLLPKLCDKCKVLDLSATKAAKQFPNLQIKRVYSPGACAACDFTGYKGQLPVAEILEMTPAVAEIIRKGSWGSEVVLSSLETENYLSSEDSLRELLENGVVAQG